MPETWQALHVAEAIASECIIYVKQRKRIFVRGWECNP